MKSKRMISIWLWTERLRTISTGSTFFLNQCLFRRFVGDEIEEENLVAIVEASFGEFSAEDVVPVVKVTKKPLESPLSFLFLWSRWQKATWKSCLFVPLSCFRFRCVFDTQDSRFLVLPRKHQSPLSLCLSPCTSSWCASDTYGSRWVQDSDTELSVWMRIKVKNPVLIAFKALFNGQNNWCQRKFAQAGCVVCLQRDCLVLFQLPLAVSSHDFFVWQSESRRLLYDRCLVCFCICAECLCAAKQSRSICSSFNLGNSWWVGWYVCVYAQHCCATKRIRWNHIYPLRFGMHVWHNSYAKKTTRTYY